MGDPQTQVVDPAVSKRKFEREISNYRENEVDYRRRGWLLLEATFPRVLVVMATPQLSPPAVVTGVLLDYTDYDLQPPSVRLVDPFTWEPYLPGALPTTLKRSVTAGVAGELPAGIQLPPGVQVPPGGQIQMMTEQPLMQWHSDDDVPFLCIAGVREYHDHPAHTGDAWLLHRANGAGRLARLLDVIDKYGLKPITQYGIQLVPQITGFRQTQPPA